MIKILVGKSRLVGSADRSANLSADQLQATPAF